MVYYALPVKGSATGKVSASLGPSLHLPSEKTLPESLSTAAKQLAAVIARSGFNVTTADSGKQFRVAAPLSNKLLLVACQLDWHKLWGNPEEASRCWFNMRIRSGGQYMWHKETHVIRSKNNHGWTIFADGSGLLKTDRLASPASNTGSHFSWVRRPRIPLWVTVNHLVNIKMSDAINN